MSDRRCGCCEGTEPLTPLPTANRPGLEALRYRVGTHSTFFETMVARLSSHRLDDGRRPLQRLTSRSPDDPAIALLDAWATVADVLTFYQERIANEGYLRTATERRSVLELARLVGYELRPGVAASVYLAFTLEQDYEIEIPKGTSAQSVPEPDELPQVFETAEPLEARTRWNAIPARRTRPSFLRPETAFEEARTLYVQGAVTGLKANGALLFVCDGHPQPYTIRSVETDAETDRTRVTYLPLGAELAEPGSGPAVSAILREGDGGEPPGSPLTRTGSLVQALRKEPSVPPPSRFQLARAPERTYSASADLAPRLLTHFEPRLRDTLYAAYAKAPAARVDEIACRVEAFRIKTAPFGHNAPPRRDFQNGKLGEPHEWALKEFRGRDADEQAFRTLSLDAVYEEILPGSTLVIVRPEHVVAQDPDSFVGPSPDQPENPPIIARVEQVRTVSRADYGLAARVTQLVLDDAWLSDKDNSLAVIRGTTVYAQSEPLELAEEPIAEDVAGDEIELDGLYDGLEAGRWLMVRGERTDIVGADREAVAGVEASELVMLAGVEHRISTVSVADETMELPGDTLHTHLILSDPLAYTYERDTVRVNANVVRATHGETRREVLGSGDGARAFQRLALKQSPLTCVAAPTPEGVESTLEVRVDGVRWPERETLLYLGGDERGYETKTDDDGETSVLFGDGKRGARLPTGVENVTAVYRSGIGKGGNVAAGAISTLATRPLGVKEVLNPQRASGGADPESRDQARRNVPLAVLALDRLVSVEDYTSFTRMFAGIGKASATSLSDGRCQVVHVTIAGADDVPIDAGSDLHRNLLRALSRFGDPSVPLRVESREAVFLFVSARVKVLEDFLWEKVEPKVRAALLDGFGFDRRELAQDVLLSEVVATAQAVEGVEYVDVDLLESVSETDAADPDALAAKLASFVSSRGSAPAPAAETESFDTSGKTPPATGGGEAAEAPEPRPRRRLVVEPARTDTKSDDSALRLRPAQLAYLNPDLPDTLILTEVTS